MVVTFLLSGLIYTTITAELSGRLNNLGTRLIANPDDTTQQRILKYQSEEAQKMRHNIITFIIILNISIFILVGTQRSLSSHMELILSNANIASSES